MTPANPCARRRARSSTRCGTMARPCCGSGGRGGGGGRALHPTPRGGGAGWARVANYHLQEAGLEVRIDHRSLQDRGSKLEPNIHLGPHASGVHARTGQGEVERESERIRRENTERIRTNPAELIVLASSQQAVFR